MCRLDDALRLERDLLDDLRRLIAQLPAEDAFRLLLERHEQKLEAAIDRIQQLRRRRAEDVEGPG
ncbi:MAG: hypothetical protein J2P40_13490 [Candidatus Dormibacteraeota bacterium]|nr:hypothetical protein [Candidatus Dormibacteraeota bacterium]MBO0762283.1 hypothetical protein [Candidatus Dormibacteraeota bacterium]